MIYAKQPYANLTTALTESASVLQMIGHTQDYLLYALHAHHQASPLKLAS